MDDVSNIRIEVFFGSDVMHIFDDFVGFYVKFGHVQRDVLFLAEETHPQVLFNVIF